MIGTILAIGGALGATGWALNKMDEAIKGDDNRVKRGRNIFGSRYRTVRGVCYRCNGTGSVRGQRCRKCGGTGEYKRTTWYD